MNKLNLFHKNSLPVNHIDNHKKAYLYIINILVIILLSGLFSGILLYAMLALFHFKHTLENETLFMFFSTSITVF